MAVTTAAKPVARAAPRSHAPAATRAKISPAEATSVESKAAVRALGREELIGPFPKLWVVFEACQFWLARHVLRGLRARVLACSQ